jgi:hypothetical protein
MFKFKAWRTLQAHDDLRSNMPVITQTIALLIFVPAGCGLFYFQKVKNFDDRLSR